MTVDEVLKKKKKKHGYQSQDMLGRKGNLDIHFLCSSKAFH